MALRVAAEDINLVPQLLFNLNLLFIIAFPCPLSSLLSPLSSLLSPLSSLLSQVISFLLLEVHTLNSVLNLMSWL